MPSRTEEHLLDAGASVNGIRISLHGWIKMYRCFAAIRGRAPVCCASFDAAAVCCTFFDAAAAAVYCTFFAAAAAAGSLRAAAGSLSAAASGSLCAAAVSLSHFWLLPLFCCPVLK